MAHTDPYDEASYHHLCKEVQKRLSDTKGEQNKKKQKGLLKADETLLSTDTKGTISRRTKEEKGKETEILRQCFEPFSSALRSLFEKEENKGEINPTPALDQMVIVKENQNRSIKPTYEDFRAIDKQEELLRKIFIQKCQALNPSSSTVSLYPSVFSNSTLSAPSSLSLSPFPSPEFSSGESSLVLPVYNCNTNSTAHYSLLSLKRRMLTIEAALPIGALSMTLDDVEKKFKLSGAKDIVQWIRAVETASTVEELLECQLVLEASINRAWLLDEWWEIQDGITRNIGDEEQEEDGDKTEIESSKKDREMEEMEDMREIREEEQEANNYRRDEDLSYQKFVPSRYENPNSDLCEIHISWKAIYNHCLPSPFLSLQQCPSSFSNLALRIYLLDRIIDYNKVRR